ncbi:hypothetical protein OSB04_017742 [Centaurea solstitialis]|uniref:Uncharacterized protein n=1 Tax=Centaurea solstitialis TaxID=347529 RepID=A0AA38WAY0_9ASTR|nr:hypothetical protein OSB04_017742 [Centaurea solstitialis]
MWRLCRGREEGSYQNGRVETFDIDLEQQKVTVKGNVQPDAVLQTVSKTGKKTEFWPAEGAAATSAA